MNNNIAVGSMARVEFSAKILEKGFHGMAVVKASPEMGFLVWLGGGGGEYSRSVTVSKSLGDISISQVFQTVGNFYYLDYGSEIFDREIESEGLCVKKGAYLLLYGQWEERQIAEPIRIACRKLGVTKLWKHQGAHIPCSPDLIVINLTERGPISIEAQC